MARVVRKVSNKAVAGQKKQKRLSTKKLIIIIACAIVVIGLAVGIPVGIHFSKDKDTEENKVDYFAEAEGVEFKKASYAGLLNYINLDFKNPQNNDQLYIEHIFVFAYDLSTFHPDSADENYVETHGKLLSMLIDLQKDIDNAKASNAIEENVELFIVDTSVGSNIALLADSDFGGDENTGASFMFTYMAYGELPKDSIKIRDKEYKIDTLITSNINTMLTTTIPQFRHYIEDGLKLEEE